MTVVLNIPVHLTIAGVQGTGIERCGEIFREEMRMACTDIGLHVSEAVKAVITGKGHYKGLWNTGHLLDSIAWSLIEATGADIGVVVGTNVDYARYKEYGTIPHFVPFSMAPSLYIEARDDWHWTVPPAKKGRELAAKGPGKAVSEGPGGLKQITGHNKTYLSASANKLWLCPKVGGKPTWGVFVSGKKEPFMWPGWEQSVEFCRARLLQAAQTAADRISAGG